jgi:hypothetical protein
MPKKILNTEGKLKPENMDYSREARFFGIICSSLQLRPNDCITFYETGITHG